VLRGRPLATTHIYDDVGQLVRTIGSPAWTDDDRALMLALQMYEDSLCRCGEPRARAWHIDMDGWYEKTDHTCTACSEMHGEPVTYQTVTDTRPPDDPLYEVPSDD
jgi:hypothetical protein